MQESVSRGVAGSIRFHVAAFRHPAVTLRGRLPTVLGFFPLLGGHTDLKGVASFAIGGGGPFCAGNGGGG